MYGNSISRTRDKVRRMTGLAILTAIIIVLQVVCTFIKFGPFSITLALAPIIVGAALYGVGAGAFLGAVFGAVVLLTGIFGWDGGTVLFLMGMNTAATVAICIVKGAAAGWLAGLVYKAISGKNVYAGVVTAGVVCPVVNTGLFILGMMTFFMSTLQSWADGQAVIYYVIFGLTGLNFLVEVAVNILLAAAITRIIRASGRLS